MMPQDELKELAEDIKKHGLLMNVIIFDGMILDGRNRALACEMAGVKIRTAIAEIPEDILPTQFVLSLNKHRRHLTPSQRAAIAVGALPLLEEEAKQRMVDAVKGVERIPHLNGKSRDMAASSVGANPRYVQDAKNIQEKSPEVFEQVKTGEKTIPQAKREIGIVKQGMRKLNEQKCIDRITNEILQFEEAFPDSHELLIADLETHIDRIKAHKSTAKSA